MENERVDNSDTISHLLKEFEQVKTQPTHKPRLTHSI